MTNIAIFDLLKLDHVQLNTRDGEPVEVLITNSGGARSDVLAGIAVKDNLITRGATRYLATIGKSARVAFSLEKNIPAGAGMAGGSSDAAACLKLLNGFFKALSPDELLALAATIGADVPFCLTGGMALVEGIGEQVTPLEGKLPYWVVIVNDGIHSDTAEAYRLLNRDRTGTLTSAERMRTGELIAEAVKTGTLETVRDLLTNDFEHPVCSRFPELLRIKQALVALGADFAFMTGSGSTMIGLFTSKDTAQEAVGKLEEVLQKKIQLVLLSSFV